MIKVKTILGVLSVVLLTTAVATAQQTKEFKWEVNQPIPDNVDHPGGLMDFQFVPDDPMGLNFIEDVDVDLLIQHTWQSDLIVEVTSPAGTTVRLLDRVGGSNDDFGNPSTGDKFILDDEANEAYPPPGSGGFGQPAGNWIPLNPLSAFDGEDKRGEWKFHVSDNAGGDTGTLINWSLHFVNTVPEPSSLMLLALCGVPLLLRRRR